MFLENRCLRIGGMEDWRIGGMEDWRIGGMKDWRIGGLQAWRTGAKGSLYWKMDASGLENWSLGVQNGSWDLQIGCKMGSEKQNMG